ncbi:hypothetical protein Tco_0054870 [Tanacetum coccineum]
MYRPSYEPPSSQPTQGYSSLNRINLDIDMENLFNTQDYYVGQDNSPVEELTAPVKAKKVSKCRQKIVTNENKESAKPWTIAKEVALCQAWCDVSENSIT